MSNFWGSLQNGAFSVRGLCVGFTGGQFAPPLPRRGKPGALRLPRTPSGPPILPLRTPHRQTARPASPCRRPLRGRIAPPSAARAVSLPTQSSALSACPSVRVLRGAGERGAGGSEASPAYRRESEANLEHERFGSNSAVRCRNQISHA